MHRYILGKTRTGKSTLLLDLMLRSGGFCLLDPHGDLAEAIADRVDCIYFDPTIIPIGLNVLKNVRSDRRHLRAAEIISSFKAIWGDSWGPRLEWILYNSVCLLLDNNASLLEIHPLLTDPAYRRRALRRATAPSFWRYEFDAWDDRYRNDAIAPVLNKVGQFGADPVLRNILGADYCLNLAKLMNTGRKLVVNLSKAKLGDAPSRLLGALLVNALYQAAQNSNRETFVLVVDEFQNFTTDTFSTILSEAGKFGLQLILAHQLLAQIPDDLSAAVLGNVGTIDCFTLSPQDARVLAPNLGLTNPDMLSDLPNYEYWENFSRPPHAVLNRTPLPTDGCGILGRNIKRSGDWYHDAQTEGRSF